MGAELTGRDGELQYIKAALDDVEHGDGRTILFTGHAGVGKTRLCQEALAEAARRSFTTLTGRAHPLRFGLALAPITQALLPYLEALPATARGRLTEALPELARAFAHHTGSTVDSIGPAAEAGTPASSIGDPELDRTRLFDALGLLLGRMAKLKPLALFVDDLHWADPGTIQLFHHLSEQLEQHPVLLLASARNVSGIRTADGGRLHELEAAIRRHPGGYVMDVAVLSDQDIALLASRAASRQLTPEELALMVARAHGVPLFLLALMAESTLGRNVPVVITDVVRQQLALLDGHQRRVLELLSVAGRARAPELSAASDFSAEQLQSTLYDLEAAGLTIHEQDGPDEFWQVAHPLYAEVAYSLTPPPERQKLHATLAAANDAGPASWADLAPHYEGAGHLLSGPKWIDVMAAAGHRALRIRAIDEAVHYLEIASKPNDSLMPGKRAALLQSLGVALVQAGKPRPAVDAWRQAAELASLSGDNDRLSALQHLLGLWEWEHGQFERSESLLTEVVLRPPPDSVEAAEHMVHLMIWTMRHGSADHLRTTAERMQRFVAPAASAETQAVQAMGRCLAHMIDGNFAEAKVEALETAAQGKACGNDIFAGTAMRELARISLLVGDMPAAVRYAEANMAGGVDAGPPNVECSGRTALALMYHFAGRMEDALEQSALGAAAARRSASPRALARAALTGSWLRAELGRPGEARALLGEAHLVYGDGLLHDAGLNSLEQLIRSALYLHTQEGAPVAPLEQWSFESDQQILCLRPLFAGLVALRDMHPAECLRYADRLRSAGRNSRVMQAFAGRLEGLAAAAGGDRMAAARLLESSASEQEHCGIRLYAAQTWTEWAELAAEQGQSTALPRVVAAVEIFDQQGISWWSDRGRRLARAMGSRIPARKSTDGPLTKREAEVAALVGAGLSNSAIARQLFLSERTVETHMRHIYTGLGLNSRVDLAAWVRANAEYVLPRMPQGPTTSEA